MKTLWQILCRVGAVAWLRVVQSLNGIAMALIPVLILVHQSYPEAISGAIGQLPPWVGIPIIFVFGFIVHYALRRAKKEIQ